MGLGVGDGGGLGFGRLHGRTELYGRILRVDGGFVVELVLAAL